VVEWEKECEAVAEVKETKPIGEPSRDALRWELEVHLAEYENVWSHVNVYIESRSTLVRYIITASAVGFGVLVNAYDPGDLRRLQALTTILLILPLLFAAAILSYLGHYRVIVAGGDYIHFRLRPRIREIIRQIDDAKKSKPETVLRLADFTGRRARNVRVLIMRGFIGLGDLGILVLPGAVSLAGFFYLTHHHYLLWNRLQTVLFYVDLALTIGVPALALGIAYIAFTRVEPMEF